MNKEKLKQMIKQVILENREKSVLLESPYLNEDRKPKYERIIDVLQGINEDVQTCAMLSGQNPMAQETDPRLNVFLDRKFKKRLGELGIRSEAIMGVFGGQAEKSGLLLNVDELTCDKLCREFKQWGFLFGTKMLKGREGSFMEFRMYEIDYDHHMGWKEDKFSKATDKIILDPDLKGVDDNVSVDPTSKKKWQIPVYPDED
tara:strand:- start:187 stop:792 length:606 start_codon:yes stop_codon:yes gene_type:complete